MHTDREDGLNLTGSDDPSVEGDDVDDAGEMETEAESESEDEDRPRRRRRRRRRHEPEPEHDLLAFQKRLPWLVKMKNFAPG